MSCWELTGTGTSSENFVFEDTTSEDKETAVKLGRSRLRVRQGSKGVLKGFKEAGPGIGQCRTACGGDKQGPWWGWDTPTTELTALSSQLWLLLLPGGPIRGQQFLMIPVPCGLLTSTEAGRCPTAVLHSALHTPTSHRPQEKPRDSHEGRIPFPRGQGSGLCSLD